MLQTVLVVCGIFVVLAFLYDIRRKTMLHQKTIQKEKSDIATLTHMTATMSTFADGKATEALLAASEDSQLFFYRLIVRGKVMQRYTLALSNVENVDLLINGNRRAPGFSSSHKMPNMRATEVAMQARQSMSQQDWAAMNEITLHIHFKSEDGERKLLPVYIFKGSTPQARNLLPKTFENAVWWQQYLTLLIAAQSPADTLNLPDQGNAPY